MSKKKFKCRICGNDDEKNVYVANEKHFGIGDKFNYIDCRACETLQIENIPEDMSKYYPEGYYSKFVIESNPFKSFIKKMWYHSYSSPFNPFAFKLRMILGKVPFSKWLDEIDVSLNDPILDVGSGSGNLLYHFNLAGFTNLTGIDPYIENDITYSNQLKILKADLNDLQKMNKKFKLITFNYSFEHLAKPLKTLQQSRQLQEIGDKLILRIPVHNSFAWKQYGTDWANLDAPRHFHIFSEKSISLLSKKSGYKVIKVIYDSTSFQFYLSILYQNNIPYTATEFGSKSPLKDFRHLVSRKDERNFKKLAKELNKQKKGDQATFYLIAT
jgi:2-polyprenyl-3-methyl-5-hydroxy-6-metoxy-1,4-benzoquinol methylase